MITIIVGIVCFFVGVVAECYLCKKGCDKLRALVKELADCLYGNPCTGCGMYSCAECKHIREMDSLVARAREEVK